VVQIVPAGYTNTTTTNISVTLTSGSTGTANYLDTRPGTLAGLVFADLDRNGIKNGADYPLTNVTLAVTGTNTFGQWVSNAVATLADGTYVFTNLWPGTNYTITETQPAGYGQGTNAVGSLGGTNAAPDVLTRIVLTQNQTGTNYNFGETVSSLGNYVWNDANADGVRQGAELGLPNVVVYLDLNHNGTNDNNEPMAITDANGYYVLTNLLSGTYAVVVKTNTLPAGAVRTYDLDGTNTANQVTALVLAAGTNRLDVNFGYRYASPTLAVLAAGTFLGYATNGGVWLQWQTLSEVGTEDYVVNRQTAAGDWEEVAFGFALNALAGGSYDALDATATVAGTYQYQLVEDQMVGAPAVLGYCTVVVGGPVLSIALEAGNIRLTWQGGEPPYHLEKCSGLGQASQVAGQNKTVHTVSVPPATGWVEVPLPDASTNTILLPKAADAAYFRLRTP
jgi:hypothetical protein